MAQMNLLQAINNALITAMTDDDKVMVFGEDVGHFGGVFRATSHLQEKFGKVLGWLAEWEMKLYQ